MPHHPLLPVLLAGGRRSERVTHMADLPARSGRTAEWPAWADPALVAGWRALGVTRPWEHQVVAAEAAWAGRHTVLATATGSGKSLAVWLPALSAVRASGGAGRRSSVLYLSPTKALAADQLSGVQRVLDASACRDVRAATCDGDTPTDERRWVQEHADAVLTNPDLLHFSLLPGHRRWARLLRGLRYVVVDECHAYRGVLGAHVALVLRRLRRVAEHYGAVPTFLLASATTADPATTAARLVGAAPDDVVAVTEDTAPRGRRTLVLWQPPLLDTGADDPSGGVTGADGRRTTDEVPPAGATADGDRLGESPAARRSATAEVADLLTDLVLSGARTLAFARSRRGAESVATTTRRHLEQVRPGLGSRVAAYRGGFLPEERRDLEDGIRTGRLTALATTNALELGVDISGLDAVLVAGWPGTRASLWQQAGRAGRAGAEGLVVLVAREDPLDTYLVHHPEAVLGAPVEATVFDPTNPYVLGPHLCAAAAELPLRSADLALFGDGTRELLDVLCERGALRRRTTGWFWTHEDPASRLTDLRGAGGRPVQVVERATGRLLGTVDATAADATLHPGAVYVHQGASFLVDDLDLETGVAMVTPRVLDHTTWARWVTSVAVRSVRAERLAGPVTWGLGAVDVTTQVVAFQRRRLPDMTVVATEPLDMPPRTLATTAVWWTAPPDLLTAAGLDAGVVPGALHAAEHAAIGLLPLLATCDRWDLGGVSTAMHADTGCATVFVHDAHPGGAGSAERDYHLGARWLRATRDAVAGCPCPSGCPACVQSPKCGNGNSPLEKEAAVRLLDTVLGHEAS